MPLAVIISTWTGAAPDRLRALVRSVNRHRAGVAFDLYLVANGEDYRVPSDLAPRFARVFVRENRGYNLGAWDHAWRALAGCDRFLFLQDDCVVRHANWLSEFDGSFDRTPRCGLVGEHLNRWWDQPWEVLERLPDSLGALTVDGVSMPRARFYREMLARWSVPEGPTAGHLTAVVHFTSRAVLEQVGGYEHAATYDEAVAAEIAFSRKIVSRGYTLVQVGRRRHSHIAHPQWPEEGPMGRLRAFLARRASRQGR